MQKPTDFNDLNIDIHARLLQGTGLQDPDNLPVAQHSAAQVNMMSADQFSEKGVFHSVDDFAGWTG